MTSGIKTAVLCSLLAVFVAAAYAGVEVDASGNIRGTRTPRARTHTRFTSADQLLEVTTAPGLYNLRSPYDRPPPMGADPKFDCAWRKLAFSYACYQFRGASRDLTGVAKALQLSKCPGAAVWVEKELSRHAASTPSVPAQPPSKDSADPRFFVDPVKGKDDKNDGSMNSPFLTIERAVTATRSARVTPGARMVVVLKAGTHYMARTLELTAADSGLVIQKWFGLDEVWLSGGRALRTDWKEVQLPTTKARVHVADLSGQGVESILGLRVDGSRAVRARYPDGNPEITHFPDGWIKDVEKWLPPTRTGADVNVTVSEPNRGGMQDMFATYEEGLGGVCNNFSPPRGYWCSNATEGGGAFTYLIPSGMQHDPHKTGRDFNNTYGAVLQTWRDAHWSSWMFEVDSYDKATHTFTWKKGGFQGARGSTQGAEWFIENMFELLDSPNEFYYDTQHSRLYYIFNTTEPAPPTPPSFVATHLKELVRITGSQANPVRNVQLQGLGFRDTSYTYMDPHGMPSGGDWALQRTAAVFAEGTEKFLVDACQFERLDGIGYMLSRYNRDATVQNSEFSWIGDSAMAAWGETDGIDGTSGDQPRNTVVQGNFVHEIGIYEKQSSCWFQAKTAQTRIVGNICYNGPRAGININDGFGGGNEISYNLIFNQCRKSSDHSVVNSWDRVPFLTDVNDGTPSLVPAWNSIHRNFMVANYACDAGCVDNDDGSQRYKTYENYFVFGGHKSDFGGHSKHHYGNYDIYAQEYGTACVQANMPIAHNGDFDEWYVNNTCVLADTKGAHYMALGVTDTPATTCDLSDPNKFTIKATGNKLHTPDGSEVPVSCNGKDVTWADYKNSPAGKLDSTTVSPNPTVDEMVQWGVDLFDIHYGPPHAPSMLSSVLGD